MMNPKTVRYSSIRLEESRRLQNYFHHFSLPDVLHTSTALKHQENKETPLLARTRLASACRLNKLNNAMKLVSVL